MAASRRAAIAGLLALLCSAIPAAAQPVTWVEAETEHFRFIFEPRDRAAVNELLTFCEPVYREITGYFHSWPKKIPVIIRGRVQQANGFTSFLPQRIELYLTAPTDHFLGARTESWLKVLLTHELTHYVHGTMDRGFFFALSHLFGPDISGASLFFLPGWMIEGPSTEMETRFSNGGRGRNPLFEMTYKAPVEQGKLFSLEQAAYGSAFPPSGRIYVGGWILLDWLARTYGEDAFRRIMDAYLGFPFLGPWAAIRKVTGKSASEVYADLKGFLEEKYASSSGIPSAKIVTPRKPGDWVHPQVTDRGIYVYHASPDGFPALVVYDPGTGLVRVLHSAVNDSLSFSATKDGATVYLSCWTQTWADPADQEILSDLYHLDARTGAIRRLTRGEALWQPAVSPDGANLIAVQGMGPYSRLVSVDPRTGSLRVLFSRTEGNVFTPAFSPDGRRVAFTFNLRGFQDVYVADWDALVRGSLPLADPRAAVSDENTAAARPVLGPDPYGEYFPSFIGADTLVFSSDREGSLSLYRADLGAGRVERIQEDPVAALSAVRVGDSLLYSSYSSDGWCLKEVPLASVTPAPVETGQAGEYPAPSAWTGPAVPQRPYRDWPGPLLWLPFPTLTRTSPGEPGVELGLGAIAYGASLLGRTTWMADAAWSFASEQPQADITVTSVAGPFTVSAESRLSYAFGTDYEESIASSVSLGLPILKDSAFGTQRMLTISGGILHRALLESPFPFTFAQSLGALGGAWQNTLFATSGISFLWQKIGGAIDVNPPLAVEAALSNATLLPVLDYPAPESDFLLGLAVNLPSIFPHHVLRLGLKASDVLGGPFSAYSDSFAVPRGFPGPSARSVPGQALVSLDYLVPIGLFDQPLAFSVAATAAAFGIHAEGIARWDNAGPAVDVDPSIYVGGDITLFMAFNAVPFAFQLGVAARIDTASPASFDAARDLGVYVSIGPQGQTVSGAAVTGRAAAR